MRSRKGYLIITAANKATESFLIVHWLRSLQTTTDQTHIDIVVLDYGLSKRAKETLKQYSVMIIPYTRDGHIVNSRLRDAAEYIQANEATYAQVLFIDSGDVIFQSDITPIFQTDTKNIRIASQNMPIDILYLFSRGAFSASTYMRMLRVVLGRPVLNAGVIVAPPGKMKMLLQEAYGCITNTQKFLTDQMGINYILHRDGYSPLSELYNFMKLFSARSVRREHGILKTAEGVTIPIVHNCGGVSYLRAFRNFGYGPQFMIPNQPVYLYTEIKSAIQRFLFRTN